MKVIALKCKDCGDTIYSRAKHDFRRCSCESCAIDGGQDDYVKISGFPDAYELITVDIKHVTLKMLIYDWNYSKDKYGLIKGKKK